jgi:ATP-dependent Clp protease ATP-binding subunit ClpC
MDSKYSFFGIDDRYLSEELCLVLDYITVRLRDEINFNILNSELFIIGVLEHKINNTVFELKFNDFNLTGLISDLREYYFNKNTGVGYKRLNNVKLNPQFKEIIEKSIVIAETNLNKYSDEGINISKINTFHILYSIILNGDSGISLIFNKHELTKEMLYEIYFTEHKSNNNEIVELFDDKYDDEIYTSVNKNKEKLEDFCVNLNKEVLKNKTEIIGRDKDVQNIFSVLCRKNKNNVMLCGDVGVGKQSIIFKLVKLINQSLVPEKLKNKKIYKLDIAKVISGTRLRGEFEERLINILEEIKIKKDVILFINDIQTLVGAGNSSNGLDAMEIIKPYLVSNYIQIIGTTTYDNYRVKLEKETSLNRKFQRLNISEPTIDETLQILKGVKGQYEKFHNIKIDDDILPKIILLSKRYLTDKLLPDSAIDLIDTTCSFINTTKFPNIEPIIDGENTKLMSNLEKSKKDCLVSQDFEKIKNIDVEIEILKKVIKRNDKKITKVLLTEEDIKTTLSNITNIPINSITDEENIKLLKMESELNKRVVGQEIAVNKITTAIIRGRVGIKKTNGCVATLFLIGESGVGKTHLAKQISLELFGSEDNMIRVDMSEFMESNSVSKLIGSAPGYVGYESGGQITEKIKNKKYCVILWDEIEKAHSSIFNLLLQLFDEGHITDSMGNVVDCKNTINIITSNVGTKQASEFGRSVGFSNVNLNNDKKQNILEKELKKRFPVEFLNRIDDIIYFNNLNDDNLKKIIRIEINKLNDIIKQTNWSVKINYDESLVEHIFKEVQKYKEFGARPIKRIIEKEIGTKLSFKLLNDNPKRGYVYNINITDNELSFND